MSGDAETEREFLFGVLCFYKNEAAEAIEHFSRSISLTPPCIEAYLIRGICHLRMGDMELAKSDFELYIDGDPRKGEGFNCLGKLMYINGYTAEAEEYFRSALLHEPQNASIHSNLGSTLVEQNKPVEAESCFKKAIKLDPDLAEAFVNLGILHFMSYDYYRAEDAFLEAAMLNENAGVWDPGVYAHLGDLYLTVGEMEPCIKSYSLALNIDPNLGNVRTKLGFAFRMAGKKEEAINQLELAIAMGGAPCEARTVLAETLLDEGRVFEAVREYKRIIRITGRQAVEPIVTLGEIFMRMEREEEAFSLFMEAFCLGERSPNVLASLSTLYENKGDSMGALFYFRLLEEKDAHDPVVLYETAKRCTESGVKGILSPEKALSLSHRLAEMTDWGHPGVLDVMAKAYAGTGDFAQAAKIESLAIEALPKGNPLLESLISRRTEYWQASLVRNE